MGTYTYNGTPQGPNSASHTGSAGATTYTYVGTGSTTYASSATMPTAAGTYNVTANLASDNVTYASASGSASFTIGTAALTVTAGNNTKAVGTTLSLGITNFTHSTLYSTDAVTAVTLTSSGSASGAAVGTFSIVPSSATGTGLSNYNISYTNGTLIVGTFYKETFSNTSLSSAIYQTSGTFTSGLAGYQNLTWNILTGSYEYSTTGIDGLNNSGVHDQVSMKMKGAAVDSVKTQTLYGLASVGYKTDVNTGTATQVSIYNADHTVLSFNTGVGTSPVTNSYTWTTPYNGAVKFGTTNNSGVTYLDSVSFVFTTPTTQVSTINFSNLSATNMTVTWSRPNGGNDNQGVIVFVGDAATATWSTPVSGTSYAANTTLGSGGQIGASGYYCVYNGTGTTVNINGLTAGNTYNVYVMEYNGISMLNDENYNSASPATGTSPQIPSCITPTLGTVTQTGSGCVGVGATISLDGLVPDKTGLSISYTINGTVHTVTNISSDANGLASFTTATLLLTNDGQTLEITAIAEGACSTTFSSGNTVILSVIPASVGGAVAATQTICAGSAPADLTLTGNTGSVVKWQSATNTGFTTGLTDLSSTSLTLNGATIGNLTINTYFRAVVGNGTCATANSSNILVTVNAASVGGTATYSGTAICSGSQPSASTTLAGRTGNVTKWQKSTLYDFSANVTDIASTSTTLTAANVGALTATTYVRSVVTNGACSAAYSVPDTITVNPHSVGGTINGAAAICSGHISASDLTLNGNTGTVTSWQKSTSPTFASGNTTIANTTTTLTATAIGILNTTTYFRAIVASGNCTSAYSDTVVITVNALPTPTFTNSKGTATVNVTNASYTTQASQSNYIWLVDGTEGVDYTIVSGGLSTTDNTVTLVWNTTGSKNVSVNYTNSNGCTAVAATNTTTIVSDLITPPVLTASSSATVDNSFDVTFTADTSWTNAISGITLNGTSLNASTDYTVGTSAITFHPSANTLMQTPGSKSIVVIATGYTNNPVSQSIAAGANYSLNITSGSIAPPLTKNGGTISTVTLNFKDQYSNITTSTESVTASIVGTNAILGGTLTQAASAGALSFSGLTVGTSDGSSQTAHLTFTSATTHLTVSTTPDFTIPAYVTAASDYFRSSGSGTWATAASWQSSPDSVSWYDASAYPTNSAKGIVIQAAHVITSTAGITYRYLTVNGTYVHGYNSGTIPTATWATGSTCSITGVTTTIPTSTSLSQYFYNFTWNCPGQTAATSCGGNLTTVHGNLSVLNTNGQILEFVSSTTGTTTVDGDLIVGSTGNVAILGFAASGSGKTTLTVNGNVDLSNGLITTGSASSASKLYLYGTGSNYTIKMGTPTTGSFNKVDLTIGDGTHVSSYKLASDFNYSSNASTARAITVAASSSFDLNGYTLTVDNSPTPLTLNGTVVANGSGSTVNFASTAAQTIPAINYYNLISSSTGSRTLANTGTIGIAGTFTAGTNTYTATGSAIAYNGATSQNVSPFTYAGLVVNNSHGVALTGTTNVDSLVLTAGTLNTSTDTLNLIRLINRTSGNINASAGAVKFSLSNSDTLPASLFTGNIYDLILASGSRYVALSNSATISHNLNLVSGVLRIAANALTINGTITTGTGSFRGSTSTDLTINGAGGFNLPLDQSSPTSLNTNNIRNFTLNTTGTVSLGIGVNMKVNTNGGNLILTKGTFDIGANTLTINGVLSSSGTGLLNVSAGTLAIGASTFTLNNSKLTSTTLNNLIIGNGGATTAVSLSGNNIIAGVLNVQTATYPAVASSLSIGTNTLTISSTGTIIGLGSLIGSSNAKLTLNGTNPSTLNFNTGTNDSLLNTLTLNGAGKVTLGTGVGITKLLTLSNSSAVLDIYGHFLTLKSTSDAATAEFDQVVGNAKIIDGTNASPYTATKVTVERYIPNGLRTFRDLGPTVYGAGSIFNNWQENGAYPSNYGMYITGKVGSFVLPTTIYDGNTGFDFTSTGNPTIYTYKSGTWASLDATLGTKGVNLDPFQGVRTLIRGARNYNLNQQFPTMKSATTLRATGTLVTGDVTFTTSGTSSTSGASSTYGLTGGADAYSLIANPYACPIDWYSIYHHNNTNNNISSSYLYLDPTFLASGYSVYITYNAVSNTTNNPAGSIGSREFIQAGQGFFVQNNGASTSPAYSDGNTTQLVISESDKVVGSTHTAVFGATKPNLLAISLWKNINGTDLNVDGTVAVFNGNFTKNIGAEDSKKIANSSENISITESVNDLSIDGLPIPNDGDVVSLKLGQVTAGAAYRLKVDVSNYAGLDAYIHDALMNTEVPATTAISFTPTTDAATYANRFSVVFKATKIMPTVNSGKLSVYPNPVTDKVVTVQTINIAAGKYNVSFINNLGQTVLTTTINHLSGSTTETIRMNKVLPSGVYTLMLKNTNGTGVYQSELLAK